MSDTQTEPAHGTYARYQKHGREGSKPCAECRQAARRYAAEYRAKRPEKYREEKRRAYARERALSRLANMHPNEYRWIYAEELGK